MMIEMTNYSYTEDAFTDLAQVCKKYDARKVVLIGGKTALEKASGKISQALENSDVKILGTFVYGKECTNTNIQALASKAEVQDADVLFAVGGGKAIDTVKTLSLILSKTVFTFPTIVSNCSAVTAISVVYNDDGSFASYELPKAPAHCFINGQIIAEAPEQYLWAGIGDALSKQPEVAFATQGKTLDHTARMGLALSATCDDALFQYSRQALEDCRANRSSEAIREISLTIVITTGYVSNLTNQADYYYNSSLAHAFYNGATRVESVHQHLHGEVVSFGVLVLHAYANDEVALSKAIAFNKSMGLPTRLADMGIQETDLERVAEAATRTNEWKHSPFPFSKEEFVDAILMADSKSA